MVRLTLLQAVLLELVLTQMFYSAKATFVENVVTAEWDGVEFYISVKREAIQKKLDAFHNSLSSACGEGPRLFIPEVSVLPNSHLSDHHPVYIDIGYLTSHDFDNYLEDNPNPCVSVSGLEVAVTIPLLAGTPTGPPVYSLGLAKFYEKSRGDIPKPNVVYPYIPVDEIKMNDYGAVVRNGSDELRFSFNRLNHPCKPSTSIVKEEFDSFFLGTLHFGLPEPDFSFCDRHSFNSDFCSNAERVRCGVHRSAPNICQVYKSDDMTRCEASVQINNITSGFRDFILLGDDPIDILASRSFSNNASIGLKYPCQEQINQ